MGKSILTKIFLLIFSFIGSIALASTDLFLNFEEGDLPSIHPHLLQGHARGRVLALLLYEGLTGVDEAGNPFLKHAKNVSISDDQLFYTFELHDNRQWSNGTPLTAFDYERSWKLAADPLGISDYSDLLYILKNGEQVKKGILPIDSLGVTALDASTLQVTLEYPAPYFLKLLAHPLFLPFSESRNVINGPFMVSQHIKDCCLELKRNAFFWNPAAISVSKISISFITDADEVLNNYHQGLLDFIGEPISRLSNEAVSLFQASGEIQQANPSRFFWIFLNTEKPPFDNLSIRQAFSAAIDREFVTASLLVGDIPLKALLPEKLSASDQIIIDANRYAAKQLFEKGLCESGYTLESFPKVTLSHFINVPGFTELAEYMQQVWSETFSIPIQLKGTEWNTFFENLQQGDFQIGGCSFDSHCHDPIEFFTRFEHKDTFNFSKWTSLDFQEKMEQLRCSSITKRTQLAKELEEMLIAEMPIIPICTHVHYYVHGKKWTNFTIDPSGCIDFSKVHLINMK